MENKSFHQLSMIFPEHTSQELMDLKEDIKVNGQIDPIILADDKILDGRGRYLVCKELKIVPKYVNYDAVKGACPDPLSFVLSKNANRRHQDFDSRRELARKVLTISPEKSDRSIASACRISCHVVSDLRRDMEEAKKIPRVEVRRDSVGRKVTKHVEEDDGDKSGGGSPRGEKVASDARHREPKGDSSSIEEPDTRRVEVKDDLGSVVPDNLVDVFCDTFYVESSAMLKKMADHVRSHQDMYPYLHVPIFFSQITNLILNIQQHEPHSVCKDCGGAGCGVCKMSGYLSFQAYVERRDSSKKKSAKSEEGSSDDVDDTQEEDFYDDSSTEDNESWEEGSDVM